MLGVDAWKPLAMIHQVLAMQSADAERMFAVLRLLKNRIRNRLEGHPLSIAMRGFSSDTSLRTFDVSAAYKWWKVRLFDSFGVSNLWMHAAENVKGA